MSRLMSVSLLVSLVLIGMFIGACLHAQSGPPKLSDAEKVEIRNAQVEMYNAKARLDQSQEAAAFQQAQSHLTDVVNRVLKNEKIDAQKWQLQMDLSFKELHPEKPSQTKK